MQNNGSETEISLQCDKGRQGDGRLWTMAMVSPFPEQMTDASGRKRKKKDPADYRGLERV